MNKFWIYFSIAAGVVFVAIVTILIINIVITKSKYHKMTTDIIELLTKITTANENCEFEKISSSKSDNIPYDYTLDTPNYKYYFKVIPNFAEYEITVNNSIKWQIRRSYTDESLNFANGVEEFMRFDPPSINNKENMKIYIIYPNSKSLLKYVNECEMEFITPDTDIYGTRVITYLTLSENIDLIEV